LSSFSNDKISTFEFVYIGFLFFFSYLFFLFNAEYRFKSAVFVLFCWASAEEDYKIYRCLSMFKVMLTRFGSLYLIVWFRLLYNLYPYFNSLNLLQVLVFWIRIRVCRRVAKLLYIVFFLGPSLLKLTDLDLDCFVCVSSFFYSIKLSFLFGF
jgi:hypothetical protein